MKTVINKIKFWYKKEFGILSVDECEKLGLEFCHNIYSDSINIYGCRSIWRDKKGKSYKCESLINRL
jgi:hypothetical protein